MELHSVGINLSSKSNPESIDPRFLTNGLLKARDKTWKVVEEIRNALKEGIQESEASKLALNIFSDFGVSKHWHKPYIRLGPGTALSFRDPLQPDYRLKPDDPFYIDVGPVWKDPDFDLEYEGDAGDTYIFGSNPEVQKCIDTAHNLFDQIHKNYPHKKMTGIEIYQTLKEKAHQQGYVLVEQVDGHRLSDFPHHKYTKERLAHLPTEPKASFWILEIQIKTPNGSYGAFFEDLLRSSL